MNEHVETLDTLQKPAGTMKILIFLREKEQATITEMLSESELSQNSAYSALKNLMDRNLVCMEKSEGFPVCKYYTLTEKGKKVAEQLGIVALMLAEEY